MADARSLGMLGYIFGGITAAVIVMSAVMVHAHIGGRLSLDGAQTIEATAVK